MTIIWGKKAYDDLDGIVDYLTNLSPEAGGDNHQPHPEGCADAGRLSWPGKESGRDRTPSADCLRHTVCDFLSRFPRPDSFLSFDERQRKLARAEGLRVQPA